MRKKIFALLIITVLCSVRVSGQYDPLSKYYLVDKTIKKCKVKKSISTPINHSDLVYVTEFDFLGRQIAWYYKKDTVTTHFEFSWNKDTLVKKHLIKINGKFSYYYKQEFFHYNSKGRITYYSAINKNHYKGEPACEVFKDIFSYDKNGYLIESKHYYTDNYPSAFKLNLSINEDSLNLLTTYKCKYNPKNNSISRQELSNQPDFDTADTLYYDMNGMLVRYAIFQKKGYMGHRIYNDIFIEFIFEKKNNEIIFTHTTSKFLQSGSIDKSISELNMCGLEIKNYSLYKTKELYSETTYEYY